MAKKVTRIAKLQFVAGQAKPGPELAGLGIEMGGFTKEFNDATRDRGNDVVPVVITAYDDRSYEFVLKTTPASRMILKAAGLDKGSQKPPVDVVGSITYQQAKEIAEYKMEDLNTDIIENAISMIIGTAKNMGITVEGQDSNVEAKPTETEEASVEEQPQDAPSEETKEEVEENE